MRVAITASLCGLLTMAVPVIWGQDQSADQMKHLSAFPVNGNRPVYLSALNIQRGVEYPASVELKGDVEIRWRVCLPQDKKGRNKGVLVCGGESIIRADEAVFHEDTGAVEAQGKVTVTTVPYHGKSK